MRLGPRLPPSLVVHQEGVVALVALVGLGLRDGSPLAGLAPRGDLLTGLAAGAAVGVAAAVLSRYALGWWRPERRLERWQKRLLGGWSRGDAAAVALFSGLAEEALVRALLQPLIGLVAATLLFAILHAVPDRRLWLWPVQALVLGTVLGLLFARWGYPAAALAHITVNLWGLRHLSRPQEA